jgi:cobalt/nickel transport system ATP-binding protein
VEFGPANLGWPPKKVSARVDRALELTGISQLRQRITQHLSYGEQKRVALAAILALEPELLLLDEPTSNLDPQGRRQLLRVLKDLPQALLVATHDLELVAELCSRAVLLEQGRKLLDGPVAELQQETYLRRLGVIE